ncbi:hypothetical protein BD779DRAFT_1436092 [Infundibulicybe gibba]|nr:hypothetical protein BD779DRAFT_1436092 [Infundibulicybe gibba]
MAPARTSSRRTHPEINPPTHPPPTEQDDIDIDEELFIDPMLGSPLSMYIEKDVEDRDVLVGLITKYGGTVAQGYSGVPYILVDPHKESGQNLYRQYVGKKGKIVLDSRWVHECVKAKQLQTFHSNYAGCKVTGSEAFCAGGATPSRRRGRQNTQPPPPTVPSHPVPVIPTVDPIVHPPFPYPVYGTSMHPQTRSIHPVVATAPPQTWQAPNGIAPQQTHLHPPPPQAHILHRSHYRDSPWDGYETTAGDAMGAPPPAGCGYAYREDQSWGAQSYYDTPFEPQYEQPANYIEEPGSSTGDPSSAPAEIAEKQPPRRRRAATQSASATPASTLVLNRNPPARSPTPPTRVIKSTYGGNLFTADDVVYLKKYIDYCQEQGLVLSLREICERIAVKAKFVYVGPHHTFYSWRRYCNKHQIRLGGYMMNPDRSESPSPEGDQDLDEEEPPVASLRAGPGPGTIAAAQQRVNNDGPRNRSPTPPRALFRSTTGKGVAFTDEDVTFLVRFMEYRKSQGRLDMVAFWKDVAIKAPHHSRASWMKFWRRHKHELNRTETDDPLPQPPDKKMRYSRDDDILLAKFFIDKPEGTSDKIFQAFGRMNPHHPWKGWQEHHRIHKAKIDHFMQKLTKGETLDSEPAAFVP